MNQLTLIQKEKLIEGIRYADSICHDHYKTDIKQFLEFLASSEFQSLLDAIQEYIVHMERKGYAAQTFNKRIQAIKHRIRLLFELSPYSDSILRLFEIEHMLQSIKLKKINSKVIDQERVLVLSEIEILLEKASPKMSLFIQFLYHTGCRVSEMLNIKLSDVTEMPKYYEIRIHGKNSKERIIKAQKELVKRIHDHFHGKIFLFETRNGKPYHRNYVSLQIVKLGRRYLEGKRISAHTLRHSFATCSFKLSLYLFWQTRNRLQMD